MSILKRFVKEESGATAVEYALIAAGIAVVLITAVEALGDELTNTLSVVQDQLQDASSPGN